VSQKFIHDWSTGVVSSSECCKHCGIFKPYVESEVVSRRCTRMPNKWWAGKQSHGEAEWVKGEANTHTTYAVGTPASVCYDDHYDIDPHSEAAMRSYKTVVITGDLVVEKKDPHVMGLSPETISWEEHKAFLRGGTRSDD
jgi:hypothetical protein